MNRVRLETWLVTAAVAAVLLWGFGCAAERQTVKSVAWPAALAAGGAIAGVPLGPPGIIAGAAIGGGAGHLIGEDASLRSGELQGSGAAELEAKRWRERAINAEAGASTLSGAFEAFKKLVHEATIAAVAGLIVYFVWRSRNHIADRGWIRGLWRGIVGEVRKAG